MQVCAAVGLNDYELIFLADVVYRIIMKYVFNLDLW